MNNFKAYIARESCGAITGAIVDEPQYKKDIAKEIAHWIREGCTVEHTDGEIVRQEFSKFPIPREDDV